MKTFKHSGRYYLKKIHKGYITPNQVADIFNISVDTVNSAYNDYCKEQNPFKRISFDYKKSAVQITISVISTLLVLLTLFEMQAGRNATYLPDISLSNTQVAICWDKNGLFDTTPEAEEIISKMSDENTITNSPPKIKIYNIGVGTAKKLSLNWDTERNIKPFVDIFNTYDDINISYNGNFVHIKTPSIDAGFGDQSKYEFDFLLNSTKEYETIAFPFSYYTLIKEAYLRTETKNLPTIHLSVSYSDVQGKEYNKNIQININISLFKQESDGSGFCIFTLTPNKENKNMSFINLHNLDSNDLTAITSIFAVIVSIISIIFTVIFSIHQLKHNRNSVRPISSIQFSDYEDKIAVTLENVGTGPLTIKKVVFKNQHTHSSDLISIMPSISQPWRTFTESVDGWTIPVNGRITFLELHPEREETKLLVRKELSKITVNIEYTDIYNTKFHDQRSFDFFGRHFE